jgi:hypothetical protein
VFVNFDAGALEKRIKSKRGEGPPVSLTHHLNARAITSSPRSPRVARPPCHLHAPAMRCRLHVHHPLALTDILYTYPLRSQVHLLSLFPIRFTTLLGPARRGFAPLLAKRCRRRAVPPRHQPGNLPPRARPPPRVREPSRQAGDLLRGIPPGFFLLPRSLHADRLHRPPSGPADHATSFASSPCGSLTTPTPTSATPPTPHRRFTPLDVRRREAVAVVSLPPPRRLKSSIHPAGNLPDLPLPPVSLSVGRISPASRQCRGRNPLSCFPGWAEMAEGVGPSRPSSAVD